MLTHSEKAVYPVLLVSVLIIAACGILYELLLSSISSYFLGNSILQFSITIGFFMFFMGAGSYLSKYIKTHLFETFILVEIALGIIGGYSAIALYMAFAYTPYFYIYNFIFIALLGGLIGLEIPIVARIVSKYSSLKETVAEVFSFDYMGALIASILFPLLLLPKLGIINTSLLIGLINLGIAFYNAVLFRKLLTSGYRQAFVTGTLILALAITMYFAPEIDHHLDQKIYQDKIIYEEQTPYQKLVLTRWNNDYRLFINGAIQFSSIDEYRYHESLVHIPMLLTKTSEKVLVLGGGDGMAVRELLKYPQIKQIDLVDLDPAMTKMGKENEILKSLNKGSLTNPKVHIYNQDAYNYVHQTSEIYSVVIIDLPDPNNTGLGKLYTKEFYSMLKGRMAVGGTLVTQATSPYFARKAYWCINHTLKSVFGQTLPYQTNVPSFGIWGFIMTTKAPKNNQTDPLYEVSSIIKMIEAGINKNSRLNTLKYLSFQKFEAMLFFEKDMAEVPTKINNLSTQPLVEYYNKSADNWR